VRGGTCILPLLCAGAMSDRGVEGMGWNRWMEGDAIGAGGGAVAVIQRECVVARRRRGW
jgi:hypothetical protein